MYYCNTYIGYQDVPDGPIVPFYIDGVYWNGDDPSDEDEHRDEYGDLMDSFYESEEFNDYTRWAYDNLVFSGSLVIDASGRSVSKSVTGFYDPRLIFENPRLGWIPSSAGNSDRIWASYTVGRSVKKGVSGNRVNFQMTPYRLFRIYEEYHNPNMMRNFHLQSDGYIHYRYNTIVARKVEGVIQLDPLANYLKRELEELYPLCQIVMQDL